MMTLIALLGTIAVMAIGASAATMGDAFVGIVIFLLPILYWSVVLIRGQRKKIDEAFAARLRQHEEDYEKMKEAHRVRAEAEYARSRRKQEEDYARAHFDRQHALREQEASMAAAAQQQTDLANAYFDRQRGLAAQQRVNGGVMFGFSDPRASFNAQQPQNNFINDTVNALMVQQMLNSGSVVTKSHYDIDTDTVVTKVIPTESVYREPDPEPQRSYSSDTSSSSSSSSDTSSDSFGGSDTSSDSF